jgi:hypothetical protein
VKPRTRLLKNGSTRKVLIPQRELRQEMEDYIKLQKFSVCSGAELDVIEEYTKILEERHMKQYLDILGKSLSENMTRKYNIRQCGRKLIYCACIVSFILRT